MKHLKTFENFDFDTEFDIDEDVLSYVFADLIDKYPHMGFELVEVDNDNFKVEFFDKEPSEKDELDDEYKYLKGDFVMKQIKGHLDVMDFNIKNLEYNKEKNRIVMTIHQLLKESNNPRKGMKSRWSVKYKKSIDCNNPKGFSQKQYCKRKRRGGSYKD
jgi:hypothetical protein